MKKMAIFLLILFVFALENAFSQEIQATVTVNMEMIDQQERVDVNSMQSDVENYINNQSFSGKEWEGDKIPIDVSIFLTGGSRGNFAARLIIQSKRQIYQTDGGTSIMIRFQDDKWRFNYGRGAVLTFNPYRFDSFTSLIDYYCCILVGLDMDTYGELDGSKLYDLAKQIVMTGAQANADGYETFTQPGQVSKYNLVRELTDPRYDDFRRYLFDYYIDGLDLMASDKAKAMENMAFTIYDLEEFKKKLSEPSVLLQWWFDAKAQELGTTFKNYKDNEIINVLKALDPSNTTVYNQILSE